MHGLVHQVHEDGGGQDYVDGLPWIRCCLRGKIDFGVNDTGDCFENISFSHVGSCLEREIYLGVDGYLEDLDVDVYLEDLGIDVYLEDLGVDVYLEDLGVDGYLEDLGVDVYPQDLGVDGHLEYLGVDGYLEDDIGLVGYFENVFVVDHHGARQENKNWSANNYL